MRERILAVLGAVCLVVVAVVVRQAISDGSDSGPGPGRGKRPVVACTSDLATVCEALVADGEIAADPPTLDLADADAPPADLDAWITWDPSSLVAGYRAGTAATGPWDTPRAVAGGRTGVLTTPEVEAALRDACGGTATVTWACVTEVASDRRALGTGSADTAEGLARLLPVASSLTDGLDPEALDVPRLKDLLDSPVSGQGTAPDLTERLVAKGPAEVAMVVGPVALLRAAAATPQGRARDLQVVIPTPLAEASVVVVPRRGATLGDLVPQVRQDRSKDALFALGLQGPGTVSGDDVAGFLYQVSKKVG